MILRILLILFFAICAPVLPVAFANPGLGVGDQVPSFTETDVSGVKFDLKSYLDSVLIISIANHSSYKRLTSLMKSANIEVLKKRPDLNLTFVSFADVSAVPRLFKGIALRAIRNISVETKRELNLLYKEESLNLRRDQTISHIIPDWEGRVWIKMQVEVKDQQGYYFWVVKDGRVVALFHEGMKNISKRYVDSILKNFSFSQTDVTKK